MITKYRIVTESDPLELENVVNDLIAKGWQPFGGVNFTCLKGDQEAVNPRDEVSFWQALVKTGD